MSIRLLSYAPMKIDPAEIAGVPRISSSHSNFQAAETSEASRDIGLIAAGSL